MINGLTKENGHYNYNPECGDTIERACIRAKHLSKRYGANVHLQFNDVCIIISEKTKPGRAEKFYFRELNRADERYQNSPEGKAAALKYAQEEEQRKVLNQAIDSKISGITLELSNQNAWDQFVAANKDDGYGAGIIRYAERWAKLMQVAILEGKKLEDIANQTSHDADDEGITGFMYGRAVSTLAQTWRHGEELRRWHNKKYQLGNEGDTANESGGVVNPAILRIEM